MFVIKLALKNKMSEIKSLFYIVGPLTLAVTIPWIMFKMIGAVCLKKRYNQLVGKVVVITGASSGLGEALAHEFYKHGAQVILCARRRQELERVRTDLLHAHCKSPTFPPIIIPLDLNNPSELQNHVDKILSITGRIDILVNNGGISNRGTVKETTLEVDQKVMAVNYFGAVALTKAVLPDMLKKKQGQIVFVSSIQGLLALPSRSSYCASKHALQAFADSLRAEVASENVFVSVISPGYIRTEMSINALTGSGEAHGEMDPNTESGYSPKYSAEQIIKAIARKKKELVLSTLLPRIAIFIRHFFPFLYFFIMDKRARQARQATLKELAKSINGEQTQ